MSINNDISVDDIMYEVHDYGERGDVESTLESVLTLLQDEYPDIYTRVAEYILDTEAADDNWVEGSGKWAELKVGDEVELRLLGDNESKRYVIKYHDADNNGLISFHVVGAPAISHILCKNVFERYLIKHWVRG